MNGVTQTVFINQTLNLALTRSIVEKVVASCTKCSLIDYTPIFTVNGTYQTFDDQTLLAYVNMNIHFTLYGLHRLRALFKQICDKISYSSPISL
ncbi:hypothetical protein KIN20_019363 [Parelaphostrongylus tenuis]|uniref:Uncharacterized protein n=1 Tax=Parelaphostrongylus tenuis TaxID=148309 RepID=A0AAD5QV16_PARTN|nr:hypothetical protein KIN20_019363 [Parelaphostrongylus tenuis]